MSRKFVTPLLALALVAATALPVQAAKEPPTWDNLVLVPSKKIDVVYLLPGADFRGYTKVMMDPTEVAFRKNFQRDYNDTIVDLSRRLSNEDISRMTSKVQTGFADVFRDAYQKAGYQVVDTPGPDVLRVRTGVLDLYVNAPDTMSAGRVRTFSSKAGEATVVIEARDSVSGAILGRPVDKRTVGDMAPYVRDSVSNRMDFENLFKSWAKSSIDGLAELKAMSPISATAPAPRK